MEVIQVRSIIVEGVDGSGKDTLIRELLGAFPDHTLHDRASTSLGGPVKNLGEWVANDAVRMSETGPWIYNRHPLISEPIYGRIRPDRPTEEPFTNPAWISAYRRIVARESVVIICQPPYHVVRTTLEQQGPDAHMPGVYDNALDLYTRYATFVWPGRVIRYNYTADTLGSLISVLHRSLGDF